MQLACQVEQLDNAEQLADVYNVLKSVMPALTENRVDPSAMLRLVNAMDAHNEQNEVASEVFVSGGTAIEEVELNKVLERLEAVALDQSTLDLPESANRSLQTPLPLQQQTQKDFKS